ncbi:protein transport protein HofC [Affinibrenneria salicis]|uniref:Type II secretion system protein F n=1 Tax=Affinibrenneria salicis TaxID=2590031 RepID=A0A5J5G5Y4_9GAMM|nr:protein transport protein HofC [Affinibrenneria salicis]KAA9002587.1 protein transport protein HofC [Affinibrenneria salicis]KAA9003125.1 protein transport protein HofC [Affinibrenneria salicis]
MALLQLYRWQAIDSEGEFHQGEYIDARRRAVFLRLIQAGYQPLRITRSGYLTAKDRHHQQRCGFIRQLATLLQAGLPLLEGLTLLAQQHERPVWRAMLQALGRQVSAGKSLSDALADYPWAFPAVYRALIATGELTGRLDECCLKLARQQEKQHQLNRTVKKSLRYPCFVMTIALLVSLLMLTLVLPQFARLYASFDTPLPALTRLLLSLADGLTRVGGAGVLLPLVLLAAYWRLRQRRPSWRHREQRALLRCPLFADLVRGNCLSQIFHILAMTQSAGLTLPAGLQAVCATLHNPLYRQLLLEMQARLQQGVALHQTLSDARLFPAPCPQLIRTGEESGTLDEIFHQLAHWHEQNTAQLAETLSQTLEPLLMLIVGVIVGTLVVAMYLPIFQLSDVLAGA